MSEKTLTEMQHDLLSRIYASAIDADNNLTGRESLAILKEAAMCFSFALQKREAV